MVGGIAIAVILVFVLPVAFLATGAVAVALLGWLLRDRADDLHEGSELIELNR